MSAPARTLAEHEARLAELYALRRAVADEITRERAAIARAKASQPVRVDLTVRPPARCGTDGGYYRHGRTLRETACPACRAAHAAAERDRKARATAALAEVAAEHQHKHEHEHDERAA